MAIENVSLNMDFKIQKEAVWHLCKQKNAPKIV